MRGNSSCPWWTNTITSRRNGSGNNLQRYDKYDRKSAKIYVGEYAAHDRDRRRSTLRSAIAEAAGMTGLERNGDIVQFASYAPLLARRNHTQWHPDLIYFTGTELFPTANYYVQQLFGQNSGDMYLTTSLAVAQNPSKLAASAVRDTKSGEVIVKSSTARMSPWQSLWPLKVWARKNFMRRGRF